MTDFKVTVLGCGSSGGVPLITGDWGVCDSENPRNRRRRPSILIQSATTTVLVDAGPDVRPQLLDSAPGKLDALVLTHDHADHTHGLDELRFMVYRQDANPLPVYMSAETERSIVQKFPYAFLKTQNNSFYPALFKEELAESSFQTGDLKFECWLQPHGKVQSLGLRVGDFAYSTDAVDLDETHFARLENLETWIVDTVRYKPHKTHAHLAMSRAWVARVKPKRAVLTHMSHEFDYATLARELPDGMEPGFDGMVLRGKQG